jgi:hypothetical protein
MFHINHYGEPTDGSLELDAIRARLEKLRQKSFDQKNLDWAIMPAESRYRY